MREERLRSLADRGRAFDTETHRVQPGLLAPPLVCGSIARLADGVVKAAILDERATVMTAQKILGDRSLVIIGANIAYDMLVLAVRAAADGVDLMPLIFQAYEDERVYDLQIAEALHAVGTGYLGKDPRTGPPPAARQLRDPLTGETPVRYNLAVVTDLVLGRVNAKVNDVYRESYALLQPLPIEEWPELARQYPLDDACNTLEVCLAQTGHLPHPGSHVFVDVHNADAQCRHCGRSVYEASAPCVSRRDRRRNLHDLANQCYSHFAMHLGAAWGFVVDQVAVDALESRVVADRAEMAKPLFAPGVLKLKKEKGQIKTSRDMATIKGRIARAYGCHGACPHCDGAQKVPSPKAQIVRCRPCKGSGLIAGLECVGCKGKGSRPNKFINCKPCDATGLVLESAPVPRTDGGKCKPCSGTGSLPDMTECDECEGEGIIQGVGTGRDALQESGDEVLIDLADWLEEEKLPGTYIPWLREGRDPYTHAPIPLTLKPNVLLETGRTSYGGCVQLLPRKGGIRECIVARPGRVFATVDYEAGELVTHAQSCIWICGFSKLADALNAGLKVHNALAATVLGISYEEFQERFSDKGAPGYQVCADARQASKPPNFGFPGRMGAAKLVLQQRKQGPDTPCPNGPTTIETEDYVGPGYKGLRFCILMDGAPRCGDEKVTEWKGRATAPLCKRCVECAERLRAKWFEQWPENKIYFDFVKHCEEEGQPLTEEQRALFGLEELEPGSIVQHVSNRIRGGAQGNSIANGWFQGLLADAAKAALRRVTRECYDATFRMPDGAMSPLYLANARVIVFTHDELIVEMDECLAHEAAHRISAVMEEELRRHCPDLAKACRAEPALMRRWYKGASPRWRDGGAKRKGPDDRLVPWEPPPKKKAA